MPNAWSANKMMLFPIGWETGREYHNIKKEKERRSSDKTNACMHTMNTHFISSTYTFICIHQSHYPRTVNHPKCNKRQERPLLLTHPFSRGKLPIEFSEWRILESRQFLTSWIEVVETKEINNRFCAFFTRGGHQTIFRGSGRIGRFWPTNRDDCAMMQQGSSRFGACCHPHNDEPHFVRQIPKGTMIRILPRHLGLDLSQQAPDCSRKLNANFSLDQQITFFG